MYSLPPHPPPPSRTVSLLVLLLLTAELVVGQIQRVELLAAAEGGGDGAGEPTEREIQLPEACCARALGKGV